MDALDRWANFYMIVGSSAGGLIGLQFVVMTLIAGSATRTEARAGDAFGTPNVVHFGVVLLQSALVVAPWDSTMIVAIIWALLGVGGMVYAIIVAKRMRAQTAYKAVLEDWIFHALLPMSAYAILAVSACFASSHMRAALFGAGAAALLLLYVGIHNAWDTVMFHVFTRNKEPEKNEQRREP